MEPCPIRRIQQIFRRQLVDSKGPSPVIPILCYHGERSWPLPINFAGQFDQKQMQPGIREFLPHYDHIVLDLSDMDPDRLVYDAAVRVVLRLLRDIRRDDLPDLLAQIYAPLSAILTREKKLATWELSLL